MLTPKQNEALSFIGKSIAANGHCPSYREIADALGLVSISGVRRLVLALEERGFIARLPRRARSIQIIRGSVQ